MARKEKSLAELGSVQGNKDGLRAAMRVLFWGELHRGPTRRLKSEATGDLAVLRGAASREELGWISERLRADAEASRSIAAGGVQGQSASSGAGVDARPVEATPAKKRRVEAGPNSEAVTPCPAVAIDGRGVDIGAVRALLPEGFS